MMPFRNRSFYFFLYHIFIVTIHGTPIVHHQSSFSNLQVQCQLLRLQTQSTYVVHVCASVTICLQTCARRCVLDRQGMNPPNGLWAARGVESPLIPAFQKQKPPPLSMVPMMQKSPTKPWFLLKIFNIRKIRAIGLWGVTSTSPGNFKMQRPFATADRLKNPRAQSSPATTR